MSVQARKEEERLKRVDPTKAAQVERLGMGFGGEWGTLDMLKNLDWLIDSLI